MQMPVWLVGKQSAFCGRGQGSFWCNLPLARGVSVSVGNEQKNKQKRKG